MSERMLMLIAGALAILTLALGLLWHPDMPERPLPQAPALPGGDFTLQSADGPVSLNDFRGKLVLLYFGYTFCPDICPTSLSATASGLNLLRPEEQVRVKMIFVSVDPERDTPARLKAYVEFFHPVITGVTGTPEVLSDIARRYGVFYAKQNVQSAGTGYVIDHTADTYVIKPDGQLSGKIAHATPPEQVVAEIRKRLNQP